MLIWLIKVISIKKLPISKAESFLKSNFDLNQIWKIVRTQNHLNVELYRNWLSLYFIKDPINAFKLQKISKNWSFKETGATYDQTFACSYNPIQNIWNPVKLEKKIKVRYLLLRVSWLLWSKFNFWKGDWALSVSNLLWDFSNISWFPQILSIKRLVRWIVYQVCYTRYQVSFYLLQIEICTKSL